MRISDLVNSTAQHLKRNSPEILTALGVSGLITTSYLTGKASYQAASIIAEEEKENGTAENRKERLVTRTKLVWKLYLPAGIAGGITAGCIIGASRANGRRTAAAITAYSLAEKGFSEYKEKVVEQIGIGKEQKIRDEIAQDRVNEKPPGSKEVLILGTGHVLCCELYTHRYFRSDMEMLRRAQNDINAKIVNQLYVSLDDFYDLVGLPYTSTSSKIGWDSDKLMELEFSTVLSADGDPCLAFDYNYTKPL